MDISGLPLITLEAAFAAQLGVASKGLMRMVEEGTLPAPFARREMKPVWRHDDIVEFFGVLHDSQSAYAPIDLILGADELQALEAYVCPAVSSGHIGNRRPSHLALYKAGAPRNADGYYEVDVYKVRWVQTQQGVAGESLAVPVGANTAGITPEPWENVRPGSPDALALFKLDIPSKQTLLVQTGVRRGGTISTSSLHTALSAKSRVSRFKGGAVHAVA